jgi:hypothetical protein
MNNKKQFDGWCRECGGFQRVHPDSRPGEPLCVGCGSVLKSYAELPAGEQGNYRFQKWFSEVVRDGKNGPSPGGAASALQCHRTMIDKLVDRGVLEKSMYDKDGFFVVLISQRSIDKAAANKEKTGKWTDAGED